MSKVKKCIKRFVELYSDGFNKLYGPMIKAGCPFYL